MNSNHSMQYPNGDFGGMRLSDMNGQENDMYR